MNFYIFAEDIYSRFIELAAAPYYHSELLWITTPLVLMILLMTFYFGRYKEEELGWNTAVGNAMVLIFVAMDLFRYLYTNSAFKDALNFIFINAKGILIASVIAFEGIWLLFANFFHIVPKRFAFFTSASLQINITAYIAIVLVYSEIPLDWATLVAALVLYFALLMVFGIIKAIEPAAKEAVGLAPAKKKRSKK